MPELGAPNPYCSPGTHAADCQSGTWWCARMRQDMVEWDAAVAAER